MSSVLAVNGAQMDSAGVCMDVAPARMCVCVSAAARLCGVASEAVSCTYTAITLSLFHSLLLAGALLLSLQTEWIMVIRGLMAEPHGEESV